VSMEYWSVNLTGLDLSPDSVEDFLRNTADEMPSGSGSTTAKILMHDNPRICTPDHMPRVPDGYTSWWIYANPCRSAPPASTRVPRTARTRAPAPPSWTYYPTPPTWPYPAPNPPYISTTVADDVDDDDDDDDDLESGDWAAIVEAFLLLGMAVVIAVLETRR